MPDAHLELPGIFFAGALDLQTFLFEVEKAVSIKIDSQWITTLVIYTWQWDTDPDSQWINVLELYTRQ